MSAFKCCRLGVLIGLVMLLLSCDVAGGLFSQSELADLYEVQIAIDGLTLGTGDLVRSDSPLVPVIESPSGVSEPVKLLLVLVDMSGNEAARLGFMVDEGLGLDPEDPSLRSVDSLKGALPSFSLPADLPEGYYSLETWLYDSSGRILSNASTLVLVYDGVIPNPQIETFPSSPAKGQPVFLRLVHDLPGEFDPWLRWYIGAGMRKEGYASEFADRLVWQVPESDGFFSVRVELFPFKPPVEVPSRSVPMLKPRLSAFRADLILAVGPAESVVSFAGIDRVYSVDFKSDPATQQMETLEGAFLPLLIIGSPYVESHEHGYGHALPVGSGYQIPGTILPQAGTPFTLSVAFEPLESLGASGAIVTLHDADDSSSFLRLGISGGLPYLEAGDHIVQAFTDLPSGLSHLVLEVVPSETDLTEAIVSIFLNNELVGNGAISGNLFAHADQSVTIVGGPEGLEAVYEDFVVTHGKYQAFLVAKTREFGRSLIAASGFEGGALGRGVSVQGSAETADGFIKLVPDSALEIPVPAAGFAVDIEGYGAPAGLVLVMEDGSLLTLSVHGPVLGLVPELDSGEAVETDPREGAEPASGVVAESDPGIAVEPVPVVVEEPDPSQNLENSLAEIFLSEGGMATANQNISLSVEAVAGGLRISDTAGRSERLPTVLSAVALRVQPAMPIPTTIQTIMVRTFNPANSFEPAAIMPPIAQGEAAN